MKQLPLKISMCKECPYFVPRQDITYTSAYPPYCNYTLAMSNHKVPIYNEYEIDSQCLLEDVREGL